MFDRFTERARRTMSLARQEALRLHHDYIGTEHILVGLLDEGTGVGAMALRNLKVAPEHVRAAVDRIVREGTNRITWGQLPFTPRAKRVLELSLEQAQELGHDYIGTEHLLLGLVREGEGVAARVLENMNVELAKVRTALEFIIGRGDRPVVGEVPKKVPSLERVVLITSNCCVE